MKTSPLLAYSFSFVVVAILFFGLEAPTAYAQSASETSYGWVMTSPRTGPICQDPISSETCDSTNVGTYSNQGTMFYGDPCNATYQCRSQTTTVNCSAAPVASGGNTTVTWSTTNAYNNTCSINFYGSGLPSSGTSNPIGPVTGPIDRSVTCSGPGGSPTCPLTITPSAPAPTVTATVSPTNIPDLGSFTVTMSSTNATSCTWSRTNSANYGAGWSNASVGGTSLNTTGSGWAGPGWATYSFTCTGAGGSATDSDTVTIAAPAPTPPDLTAGAVSPGTATAGVSKIFSGDVSNLGGHTGGDFPVLWQVADSAAGAGVTDIGGVPNQGPLAAGASLTSSIAHTFSTGGTKYLRICADHYNGSMTITNIAESNENNNCGPWTQTVIAPAPTVNIYFQ